MGQVSGVKCRCRCGCFADTVRVGTQRLFCRRCWEYADSDFDAPHGPKGIALRTPRHPTEDAQSTAPCVEPGCPGVEGFDGTHNPGCDTCGGTGQIPVSEKL